MFHRRDKRQPLATLLPRSDSTTCWPTKRCATTPGVSRQRDHAERNTSARSVSAAGGARCLRDAPSKRRSSSSRSPTPSDLSDEIRGLNAGIGMMETHLAQTEERAEAAASPRSKSARTHWGCAGSLRPSASTTPRSWPKVRVLVQPKRSSIRSSGASPRLRCSKVATRCSTLIVACSTRAFDGTSSTHLRSTI